MKPKYGISLDGDPTREVVLEYEGDWTPHWELYTQRYRTYKDHKGQTRNTEVGKQHLLCSFYRAFGKLFCEIEKSTFHDTGLRDWKRKVFDAARADFLRFLQDTFGLTINELEFPQYTSPSKKCWNNKDEWDWIISIPNVEFISHRDQCESYVRPIQTVLDAQLLLVEHGFKGLANNLTEELEERQAKMKKVLHFDEVVSDTRMSDIPKWVWDDEREVCKKRKAKIAKEFEHILEKKVVL